MKPATKTTLCMLLAASIGSAATATCLWEMERRDPLYRLTRGAGAQAPFPNKASRWYRIPPNPIPLSHGDFNESYKEQVYDAAIKARGESFYIRETIQQQPIAYTTDTAQKMYHKALSRIHTLDSDNCPTDQPKIATILHNTFDSVFGESYEVLQDGTPVIDYRRAVQILCSVASPEEIEPTLSTLAR